MNDNFTHRCNLNPGDIVLIKPRSGKISSLDLDHHYEIESKTMDGKFGIIIDLQRDIDYRTISSVEVMWNNIIWTLFPWEVQKIDQ